jgi:ArsR family transcriptional regulator
LLYEARFNLTGKINDITSLNQAVKASAGRNRIRIIYLLLQREMCVCELSFVLGISQPSVSRHLRKLKEAGFIDSRRAGPWTNYMISPANGYAESFVRLLSNWLKSDNTVRRDRDRMKEADRERLSGISDKG